MIKVVDMPQETRIALLDKYLAGDCTEDERKQVEDWIERVGRYQNEWSSMGPEQQQKYLQALYSQVIHPLGVKHEDTTEGQPTAPSVAAVMPLRPRRIWRVWTAAACLVSLLAVGAVLYKQKSSHSSPVPHPRITWITQSTQTGQIKQVTLPDSTHVWLNAASSILYAKGFNQASRKVFLNGEAFFEVAKDKDKPFVIQTQNMTTQVLGTSFNISGYASDDDFHVAVLTGRVEVSRVSVNSGKSWSPETVLEANQLVTFTKKDGKFDKKSIPDATVYADWRSGKLAFHHTEMQTVVRKLQHIYSLQITIRDRAITGSRISGHFKVQQPAAEVIRSICLSIGATYQIKGSRVTIMERK